MVEHLTTAISGSFKFKPEIDALYEEFADHYVTVLEPAKGWLYVPTRLPSRFPSRESFRALPNEVGMTVVQIEERFFRAVEHADFMYLNNLEGYIGESMGGEIAHAWHHKKPIFAREPITRDNGDGNLGFYAMLLTTIVIATPGESAAIMRERSFDAHRMSDTEVGAKILTAISENRPPMYSVGEVMGV